MPYDDVHLFDEFPLLTEGLPQDLSDPDREFICPDPELRKRSLQAYLNNALSAVQHSEFKQHLRLCRKCREYVEYQQWLTRWLRRCYHLEPHMPVPLHALYDFAHTDLLPYYKDRPLTDELAAASVRVSGTKFPITAEYLDGQVVGEFWKRVGCLFFHLKRSIIGTKRVACILIYTAESDDKKVRKFEFQEGEQKNLGPFPEFVASETIQDVVQAIRRFQLVVKAQV